MAKYQFLFRCPRSLKWPIIRYHAKRAGFYRKEGDVEILETDNPMVAYEMFKRYRHWKGVGFRRDNALRVEWGR